MHYQFLSCSKFYIKANQYNKKSNIYTLRPPRRYTVPFCYLGKKIDSHVKRDGKKAKCTILQTRMNLFLIML